MDLHRRQTIWLQQVGCLAHNNAQRIMWEHQIEILEIHQTKTLNSGNHRINFIHHRGIVTYVRSYHFQALPSSTTLPHSTWHQACNQAVVQPNDIRVMGHGAKNTTSPKDVMVDLKCCPLGNSQDRGHHLQTHHKCLQHHLETFQSFGRHLLLLLHMANFPADLGNLPLVSQWDDFSRLQNHAEQMLQGLQICLYYQAFWMTNRMQIMRAMICRTWAGPKAQPKTALSKRNSAWMSLPKW